MKLSLIAIFLTGVLFGVGAIAVLPPASTIPAFHVVKSTREAKYDYARVACYSGNRGLIFYGMMKFNPGSLIEHSNNGFSVEGIQIGTNGRLYNPGPCNSNSKPLDEIRPVYLSCASGKVLFAPEGLCFGSRIYLAQ